MHEAAGYPALWIRAAPFFFTHVQARAAHTGSRRGPLRRTDCRSHSLERPQSVCQSHTTAPQTA